MNLASQATTAFGTLSPRTDSCQPPADFFDDPILPAESQMTDPRIRKTIELLRINLHLTPSLEAIARTLNLSESRVRCLFREATGLPLGHYVKSLRMETARHLLATEFLTVKEVMAKTGFKDPSHFNRNFKTAYGVTPSRYRNQSKRSGGQAFPDSNS